MPRSEKSNRALARTSFSCHIASAVKIGRASDQCGAGLALCATAQIEHDDDSVCVGWLWTDSAAAVHSIRDRQSHADQRITERTRSRIRIEKQCFLKVTTVVCRSAIQDNLL